MKKFHKVSRLFAVATVAFVGSAAAHCPVFAHKLFEHLNHNKEAVVGAFVADHLCAKNDHLKKAFIVTTMHAMDHKGGVMHHHQFGERFAVDYLVRKGSDMVGLDGLRDAVLKKCDVLPAGMIRDNLNPVIEGAAQVVTHPEFLTYVVMAHLIPTVTGAHPKPGSETTKS